MTARRPDRNYACSAAGDVQRFHASCRSQPC